MHAPSRLLRVHPGECALGECVSANSVPTWDLEIGIWRYEVRIDESTGGESKTYPVAIRIFTAALCQDEHGGREAVWIRDS